MDAFEHQLARELARRAGPIQPVDDAAIYRGIGAAKTPRRTFGALFGASRFAIAGLVVAGFGGLMLMLLLTQPPRQDRVPAVAASPSRAPASTALPRPTATVAPVPSAEPPSLSVTTSEFVQPFRYTIPTAMPAHATYEDAEVFAIAVGDPALLEASARLFGRIQGDAPETGAYGILIADVTEADAGICSGQDGPAYAYPDSEPSAFLRDLQDISGLRLDDEGATTLGGRSAVAARSVWARCGFAEIIVGSRPIWEAFARLEIPSRLIVARVGASTIMAQVWAGTQLDLERWLPIAQEFLDSMEFLEGGGADQAGQLPTPSP